MPTWLSQFARDTRRMQPQGRRQKNRFFGGFGGRDWRSGTVRTQHSTGGGSRGGFNNQSTNMNSGMGGRPPPTMNNNRGPPQGDGQATDWWSAG